MRVQTWESHRACGDSACLHRQSSPRGCDTRWHWWGSGGPLCQGPAWIRSPGSPRKLAGNPFPGSHLPNSQVVWLWWVKGVRTQMSIGAASLKPRVQACQGTPKLGSLGVCCQGGGGVAGKEVPLVGIAQPGAGCRRTSHSSGQSQSVTKTNVGKRTLSQAKGNNEYFSLLADAFVLAANAEVHCKKGYCADKKCVWANVYTKQLEEGRQTAKGRVPWNRQGFQEHHQFLRVCLLLILLHWTSSRRGRVAPCRPAAKPQLSGDVGSRWQEGGLGPPEPPGAVYGVEGIHSHPAPYCQGPLN